MDIFPRISFGLIVLNGEPFTRYCLGTIYPFAHQIIVVEGATHGAAPIASHAGHSTDGTLESLKTFKMTEDLENKLIIVTAEDEGYPDGFWPGEKHEMSQAYAKRATGDYLWQVDIDEFYKANDIQSVLQMLRDDSEITTVSFKTITFWGGFDYITDGWYLRGGDEIFHRLFKWGDGYQYRTHRPPTVYDAQNRDLRSLKWVNGYEMARRGIYLHHYSTILPKQVIEKSEYYGNAKWAESDRSPQWAQEVFMKLRNPYRVHGVYRYPSWLERFYGSHPEQIESLRSDLLDGRAGIKMRQIDDIELLLDCPGYRAGRAILKMLAPIYRFLKLWQSKFYHLIRDPIGVAASQKKKLQQIIIKWL